MNERIKLLALQAGMWRQHYDLGEESPERLEKFAELIVKECDRVIKDSVSTMERGKLRASIARAGTLIKEHFGVE